MSQQTFQTTPSGVQPGDEFYDPAGRKVRVLGSQQGRYGIYRFSVEVLSPEEVAYDYAATITVTREVPDE